MGSLRFFVVIFFAVFSLHGQNEGNFWYFGTSGLDFNSGTPISLGNSAMQTQEGCATISDNFGNLLFYTDGITIWNRNHQEMLNGTDLLGGDSSTQSAAIVPRPGNPGIYYVFTIGTEGNNGLNYSEVDMELDGGLGGVTSFRNVNLASPGSEKLTTVLHDNGEDVWVLSYSVGEDKFLAFLVSSSGVSDVPISTTLGLNFVSSLGSLKSSPSGDNLVMCSTNSSHIFNFDISSGIVSNPIELSDTSVSYGAEFSPSGRFLYISREDQGIYQYDMQATNIDASRVQVFTPSGNESTWQMQVGPDDKIYVARLSDYLGVVNNPDEQGLACDYVHNGLSLGLRESRLGLPDFISRPFVLTTFVSQNYCAESPTDFLLSNEPDSVLWDFGDPTSGPNNSSTELGPSHIYENPGFYTVRVTAVFGSDSYTDEKVIQIFPKPNFEFSSAELCKLSDFSQNISVQGLISNYSFSWLNADDEFVGTDVDISTLETGTYKVFATSPSGCTSDIKEVSIIGSTIGEITREHIEIIDNSDNNLIRVRLGNINTSDLEFQLLDRNLSIVADYQSNATFTNLEAGIYLLNIRDKAGCGSWSFELSLLNFPDFFTPNGDGINDHWGISGLERAYYQDATVTIFSRFGKLLGKFTLQDIGWNGMYGGNLLPPNDYWYEVRLVEQDGTQRKIHGHFSLLRK